MANKAECVGCKEYSSRVFQGLMNQDLCPNCGFTGEAMRTVDLFRFAKMPERLVEKYIEAEKANVHLRDALARAEAALNPIVAAVYEYHEKLEQINERDEDAADRG